MLEELFVIKNDCAAPAEAEFACGEIDDVHCVRKGAHDFTNALVGIGGFAGFDKVQIVLKQACVKNGKHSVFFAQFGYCKHVVKRNGLAADEICAGFNADKGDIVALLFEHAFKLFKIEIALERVGTLPVKPVFLQTGNVVAAAVFYFADRGAELEVHRNDRTRAWAARTQAQAYVHRRGPDEREENNPC